MTKNNFWTSGLRLLTKAWQNLFSSFNESEADANDILLSREQAEIPVICVKERQRKRGRRAGCLLRIHRRSNKPPLPSILLATVQSLDNNIDDLHRILHYQRDIQNCNILCFTESWLNNNMAEYMLIRQDRTAASCKTRGRGLCIFFINSWCTKSNSKEVPKLKSVLPHFYQHLTFATRGEKNL